MGKRFVLFAKCFECDPGVGQRQRVGWCQRKRGKTVFERGFVQAESAADRGGGQVGLRVCGIDQNGLFKSEQRGFQVAESVLTGAQPEPVRCRRLYGNQLGKGISCPFPAP